MSERKPPPRPPPPRQPAKAGQTSTQGRFRDAFASISIRYSNTSKDSESDEEISIVRKAEASSPDVQENDSGKEREAVEHAPDTCRPEVGNETTNGLTREGKLTIVESKSLQEIDYASHESKSRLSRGADPKRQSWPVASSTDHLAADPLGPMKFLRGREPNSRPAEASKVQVSLSEKEESNAASQPLKSHLQAADNETTISNSRSRSPSRFRQDGTQKKSGISLSSLLAADKKCESDSDSEVEENFLDACSEPPSSPERNINEKTKLKRDSFNTSKGNKLRRGSRAADRGPAVSTFCLCTLVVYIYFISTPPPFLSGLFTGVIFTYLAGCLFLWLFCPQDTIAERFQREMLEYEDRLAGVSVREYKSADPGLLLGIRELKGWMYKAYDYKPEHFDFNSQTTPVLACLKGTKLTLSHPNLLNSTKRFDPRTVEDDTNIVFSRHEFFDINGSSVSLLPSSLTLKRLWSKKFPICLELGNPGAVTEDTSTSPDEEGEKPSLMKMRFHKSFEDIEKVYLFARTGREKEEWYNHLRKILNPVKGTTSDLDEILHPSCSYPHYMARLLPLADSKLQQAQMAWINVLFGRAFWDVWQSHYWADKVRQRFQNKLSKMRKPQFIKDISIADLSLGHSLPIINRASPPVVDERGTWVDLDVTYSGGLVFTLEGHLNVEGYLRYFIDLGRGGNSDVTADVEMTELQQKYDLEEDEESVIITAKKANKDEVEEDVESESPPLSDSDFESPESDLDEFASSDCQSLPSSPLLSPRMDVFHNAIESSAGSEDAVDAVESQNEEHFFPSSPAGPEEQIRSSYDERGKLSPLSSPKKGPEKQMEDNPSGSSRMTQVDMLPKSGAKKKIFGVIERLAKSKWVKKAVETDLVKRAAEKFSNLPITLSVEVQTIKGVLALNIPPPPTNRLWYGFKGHPLLCVSARPKLGERQVKLTHVTDWIEKKLKHEFKNMFVLPNMEDLPIKLMNSGFEGQFPEQ